MTLCLNALGHEQQVDLLLDRGFLVGDGVYETLRVEDGIVLWLEEHVERLRGSALKIRLPFPWSMGSLVAFLRPMLVHDGLARMRLTLTAGEGGRGFIRPAKLEPRLFAQCSSTESQKPLEDLGVCPFKVPLDWPAKTLSGLHRILAAPPSGTEWVMVNEDGHVTEATMANIFWVRHEMWQTPAVAPSLLPGLTRQRVLHLARSLGVRVQEGSYTLEDLRAADEVMITGTVAGLVPIKRFEGRILRTDFIEKMRTGYDLLVKNEIARSKKALFG